MAVTMGGKDEPVVSKLMAYADTLGGNPQATIFGHAVKKNVSQAAMINGTASHALDYDDTLVSFFGHPSVTLFPSLLALSEWQDKSGQDFLTAYLVGLSGRRHHWCSAVWTITWPAGMPRPRLVIWRRQPGVPGFWVWIRHRQTYALGIAATQASGLKRVFGTMCKPYHAGKSAQAGLMAALLAKNDFTSAEDILEGPQGFFEVLKGSVNEDVLALLGLDGM
ncbi:MAG: MmgE/PrpD family protein [Desulfobacterales bacterium]